MKNMNSLSKQIEKEGFVFRKFRPSEDFRNIILNNTCDSPLVELEIKKILRKFNCPTDKLQIVFEDFLENDSNDLHTHLIAADFQVLMWATKSNFKGRDFIYTNELGEEKRFSPSFDDICFMKTNDLNFKHGVSKLETNCLVRTIIISVNCLAKKGEHLTISKRLEPI
jgi:hypothetical protein